MLLANFTYQTRINNNTDLKAKGFEECTRKLLDSLIDWHDNITSSTNNSINNTMKIENVLAPLPPECHAQLEIGYSLNSVVNSMSGNFIKFIKVCRDQGGKINIITQKCMQGNKTISSPAVLINTRVTFYITVAGCCISLTCLMLLLVTHVLFKELQTVHGKTIMALSIVFLPFHVIQLIIEFNPRGNFCTFLGICLHWVALMIFMWKLTASFDLWKTFHKVINISAEKTTKKWKLYVVVSTLVPTAIVAVCVIMQFGGNIGMGYGGYGECFITDEISYIVAFMLPMFLIITMSSVLLAVAFRNIKKQMAESETLQMVAVIQKEKKKQAQKGKILLNLILRMMLLGGTGWMFFIIDFLIPNSFCRYASLVVIDFQGTFLLVVYGMNKQTLKLYKKQFYKYLKTPTPHGISADGAQSNVTTITEYSSSTI